MATERSSAKTAKLKFSVFLIVLIILKTSRNCYSQRFATKNIVNIPSIRCIIKDPSYIRFSKCILKPINRRYKLVDIQGELLKPFEKSVLVHFQVLKRANGGFKPFVIDVTMDACKYLAGKRNLVYDWFHNITSPYTNLNHTCPFNGDVIIKYPTQRIVVLPSVFPEGEYLFEVQFGTNGVSRVALRAYITLKED